ncbi:hypothetical protein [Polaribacter aquimarinus]|nr:hypothetical protein [Polaribacter aquimarinus]
MNNLKTTKCQHCINFIAAKFFLRKNTQAQSCLIFCLLLAKQNATKLIPKRWQQVKISTDKQVFLMKNTDEVIDLKKITQFFWKKRNEWEKLSDFEQNEIYKQFLNRRTILSDKILDFKEHSHFTNIKTEKLSYKKDYKSITNQSLYSLAKTEVKTINSSFFDFFEIAGYFSTKDKEYIKNNYKLFLRNQCDLIGNIELIGFSIYKDGAYSKNRKICLTIHIENCIIKKSTNNWMNQEYFEIPYEIDEFKKEREILKANKELESKKSKERIKNFEKQKALEKNKKNMKLAFGISIFIMLFIWKCS